MAFKDEKIGLIEEREEALKAEMGRIHLSMGVALGEAESARNKRIEAETALIAAEERLNFKLQELEKYKAQMVELEGINAQLRESLGIKINKTKKIQDLQEMTVLIGNYRRKQIFNN